MFWDAIINSKIQYRIKFKDNILVYKLNEINVKVSVLR